MATELWMWWMWYVSGRNMNMEPVRACGKCASKCVYYITYIHNEKGKIPDAHNDSLLSFCSLFSPSLSANFPKCRMKYKLRIIIKYNMYSHMPHWYFIVDRFLSAVIINYIYIRAYIHRTESPRRAREKREQCIASHHLVSNTESKKLNFSLSIYSSSSTQDTPH